MFNNNATRYTVKIDIFLLNKRIIPSKITTHTIKNSPSSIIRISDASKRGDRKRFHHVLKKLIMIVNFMEILYGRVGKFSKKITFVMIDNFYIFFPKLPFGTSLSTTNEQRTFKNTIPNKHLKIS